MMTVRTFSARSSCAKNAVRAALQPTVQELHESVLALLGRMLPLERIGAPLAAHERHQIAGEPLAGTERLV